MTIYHFLKHLIRDRYEVKTYYYYNNYHTLLKICPITSACCMLCLVIGRKTSDRRVDTYTTAALLANEAYYISRSFAGPIERVSISGNASSTAMHAFLL